MSFEKMSVSDIYRDKDIRLILLEYITSKYAHKEHYVALEARYGATDRRADVLVISDHSHAYEIKSDADRLDRLPFQLKDYRKTFDYLTVVTTQTHAVNVKKMLSENDGLIVISQHGITEVLIPKCNKKITKKNMIAMCSKKVLANLLALPFGSYSLDVLRERAESGVPVAVLRQFVLKELERRFKEKYDAFLAEASVPYREYDLALLQHSDKLNVRYLVA